MGLHDAWPAEQLAPVAATAAENVFRMRMDELVPWNIYSPRAIDYLSLFSCLVTGAAWLAFLYFGLLGNAALVAIGVAYVAVVSVVIAAIHGHTGWRARPSALARLGLWGSAVATWTLAARYIGTGDVLPILVALQVGVVVGTGCLVAWVGSSFVVRWALSKVPSRA